MLFGVIAIAADRPPDGTYLAWLDCTAFGAGGDRSFRFNFASPSRFSLRCREDRRPQRQIGVNPSVWPTNRSGCVDQLQAAAGDISGRLLCHKSGVGTLLPLGGSAGMVEEW